MESLLMAVAVAVMTILTELTAPLLSGVAVVVADTMVGALWALAVSHFLAAKVAPLKLWV
jgi:hypothetical protein